MGDQPKIAAKDVRAGMRVKFPASEFMLYDGVHEVEEQPEPEEDGMVSIPVCWPAWQYDDVLVPADIELELIEGTPDG